MAQDCPNAAVGRYLETGQRAAGGGRLKIGQGAGALNDAGLTEGFGFVSRP
jgi:hypothetical protein